MTGSLAEHSAEFVAEFEAIEYQLAQACADLGRLMTSYRLNVAGLADAQAHALASTKALCTVAAGIHTGNPRQVKPTRPQDCPGTLGDQLADARANIAQVLALVQHMPGINPNDVGTRSALIAHHLHDMERLARVHQPSKARQ